MSGSAGGGRVVCLGEAIVDLVCPEPVPSLGDAPQLVPGVGGSLANIAVAAARFGTAVSFLGGAGDDEWGRWLRDQIAASEVDVAGFALVPGPSSLAFVAVSAGGEPSFAFYEATVRPAAHAGPDLDAALAGGPGVLVLGSDTMLGEEELRVTLHAADRARERGWTVLVDPNLRPVRWVDEATMREAVGALVERASVIKCNAGEARELTGEATDEDAARALLAQGPETVVVTRGGRGALLVTSEVARAVAAPAVDRVVDATGAGDSVSGVLAAALAAGAHGAALEAALGVAMRAAGGVVREWGASAGLPPREEAEAELAAAVSRGHPPDRRA